MMSLVPLFVAGCGSGVTTPIRLASLSIRVDVSGGFAGADLSYAVDPDGTIVAARCQALCSFEPGDTLHQLSPAQVETLGDAIERSGIADVVGIRDFGVQCCDQFEYTLVVSDDLAERTIHGSSEVLPEEVGELVRLLESYRLGVDPIVVEMEGELTGWRADAVDIADATLAPPLLHLTVRYGGGCTRHDLDLVAWSGWRESFPVQVGVALAHDAHDDRCRALVTREITFDLADLRRAYVDAYGAGPATIGIVLAPTDSGSAGGRRIDWTF